MLSSNSDVIVLTYEDVIRKDTSINVAEPPGEKYPALLQFVPRDLSHERPEPFGSHILCFLFPCEGLGTQSGFSPTQ